MSECLFCRILDGEIPSRRVYEDDTCIGFLDINPLHRGHTLLIPRRHVADGTCDAESWEDIALGIVAVSALVKEKLGASAVNILSNAGADSGQEVFHFHVHVIPRFPDHPGMAGLMHRTLGLANELDDVHALLTSQG